MRGRQPGCGCAATRQGGGVPCSGAGPVDRAPSPSSWMNVDRWCGAPLQQAGTHERTASRAVTAMGRNAAQAAVPLPASDAMACAALIIRTAPRQLLPGVGNWHHYKTLGECCTRPLKSLLVSQKIHPGGP